MVLVLAYFNSSFFSISSKCFLASYAARPLVKAPAKAPAALIYPFPGASLYPALAPNAAASRVPKSIVSAIIL